MDMNAAADKLDKGMNEEEWDVDEMQRRKEEHVRVCVCVCGGGEGGWSTSICVSCAGIPLQNIPLCLPVPARGGSMGASQKFYWRRGVE